MNYEQALALHLACFAKEHAVFNPEQIIGFRHDEGGLGYRVDYCVSCYEEKVAEHVDAGEDDEARDLVDWSRPIRWKENSTGFECSECGGLLP